jgi:hypothetical protein
MRTFCDLKTSCRWQVMATLGSFETSMSISKLYGLTQHSSPWNPQISRFTTSCSQKIEKNPKIYLCALRARSGELQRVHDYSPVRYKWRPLRLPLVFACRLRYHLKQVITNFWDCQAPLSLQPLRITHYLETRPHLARYQNKSFVKVSTVSECVSVRLLPLCSFHPFHPSPKGNKHWPNSTSNDPL